MQVAKRAGKLIVCIAFAALLLSSAYLIWQDFLWKREMYGLAGEVGTRRAAADYRQGKMRIYRVRLDKTAEVFSGEHDGIFEVWVPYYSPILGRPHRIATQIVSDFYNRKMRSLAQSKPALLPEDN